MYIRKEVLRVLLNLADVKPCTSVCAVLYNSSGKWTSDAAHADSLALGLLLVNGDRVGESHARRAVLPLGSLVNVRRRLGRRLVVAPESVDLNAVADGVRIGDDAVVEEAVGVFETAGKSCRSPRTVDDLVRSGFDAISGSEDLRGGDPFGVAFATVVYLFPIDIAVINL